MKLRHFSTIAVPIAQWSVGPRIEKMVFGFEKMGTFCVFLGAFRYLVLFSVKDRSFTARAGT